MTWRLIPVAVVVALCAPAAASAAPVVVVTGPDGARVAVQDAKGAAAAALRAPVAVDRTGFVAITALCLQVLAPGDPVGKDCDERPLPTVDDPVAGVESGNAHGLWVGGAVAGAAAVVEVVPDRGEVIRVPAVEGGYAGAYAGRVRFFVAALPDSAGVRAARVLDAGGAVIGGAGLENPRRTGRSVRLARGRIAGGGHWSAIARVGEIPAPAAGAPERREATVCLSVSLAADGFSTTASACRDRRRVEAGLLLRLPDCRTQRTAIAALLPPGARGAALVLGDGRRVRMRESALPARFGARQRAAAAVVRGAIRSLRVGTRVRRLGFPPAATDCSLADRPEGRLDGSGLPGPFANRGLDLFPPTSAPVAEAQPVTGNLVAAVRGDDVCAGLGGLPRSPDGCAPAPLRARESRIAGVRGTVGVVTAPSVASVALLDAGTFPVRQVAVAQTVPLGAGRAAVLAAPAGMPLAARMLDAQGHALADIGLGPVAAAKPRTIARGPRWIATATRILVPTALLEGILPADVTCTQVTARAPRTLSEDCLDDGTGRIRILATCAPRLVHVFGVGRRVTLVLADGRRRAATVRRGAFHAVLRGQEALRRVVMRGAAASLHVPAPAEQCGYRAEGLATG